VASAFFMVRRARLAGPARLGFLGPDWSGVEPSFSGKSERPRLVRGLRRPSFVVLLSLDIRYRNQLQEALRY